MQNRIFIFSLGIVAGILFAAVCIFVFVLLTDRGMIFPREPNGSFVQTPSLVNESQERHVEWVVPVKCAINSYEAQEEGYEHDSGMLWGGIGNTSCDQTAYGYQCRAEPLPEMQDENKRWIIQAHGYGCSDGNDYISEPTTVY